MNKNGSNLVLLDEIVVPPENVISGDPYHFLRDAAFIDAMLTSTDALCEYVLRKRLAETVLDHEGLGLFVNEGLSSTKGNEFSLIAAHNVSGQLSEGVGRIFTMPIDDNGRKVIGRPDIEGWDFFLGIKEEKVKDPKICAVLGINNTETPPDQFNDDDWAIIKVFGDYISWLFARRNFIEHMSERDEKTGAYNARWLRKKITELETLRMTDSLGPLTIAFLDVDNFREVNEMSHLFADQAMRHLCQMFQSVVKNNDYIRDYVVRYGKGDELVIVFRNARIQDIFNRFMGVYQKNRQQSGIIHDAQSWAFESSLDGEAKISIPGFELSVGLAELRPTDGTIMQVLHRADVLQGFVKLTTKCDVLADFQVEEVAKREAEVRQATKE